MPGQSSSCTTFTRAEMSEIVCNGCPTILVYRRGVTSIRCPNCCTSNSTRSGVDQYGHVQCGRCRTTLAYPMMEPPSSGGAPAAVVHCARCRHVNPVSRDARLPQTVLVENPKTLDDKGKLVRNVAVGVASRKR